MDEGGNGGMGLAFLNCLLSESGELQVSILPRMSILDIRWLLDIVSHSRIMRPL